MKVNVNEELKTLDGKKIPNDPKNLESAGMTLKDICVTALLTPIEDEKLEGSEKAKRYMLAQKIYDAKETVDLSSEDIVLLKKLIGSFYLPLIVGQAYVLLEK